VKSVDVQISGVGHCAASYVIQDLVNLFLRPTEIGEVFKSSLGSRSIRWHDHDVDERSIDVAIQSRRLTMLLYLWST
jgi:hypothetical protein